MLKLNVRNPGNIKVVDTLITPFDQIFQGYNCIIRNT